MSDGLEICPRCGKPDSCYVAPVNETKNSYQCFNCGYYTTDLMLKEDFDFDKFEESLPYLYSDLKTEDDQGRVWYPQAINIQELGTVFASGTGKDDWAWSAIKSIELTEEEKKKPAFASHTHKSNPSTLKAFGKEGFFEACDYIGMFDQIQ